MEKSLNVAVLQVNLAWENITKNLDVFNEKIELIPGEIDLIVLPEMFSTGFSMNAEELAEPPKGRALQWMQKIAESRDTAITGSVIVKEDGKFYNRLYFVFPDTSYKVYDKRHTFTLAGEDKTYTAGKDRLIVEYKGWRICPLICYDLRFPVWSRNNDNYDLLIYVANWPETRIHAWDVLLQARAIENMAWCIGVNRTGEDGNAYKYNGHTGVYDCLGKSMFNDAREIEFTEVVTLDKDSLLETREKLRFLQDRDRFSLV